MPISHHLHGVKAPLVRASLVKRRYTKYLALPLPLLQLCEKLYLKNLVHTYSCYSYSDAVCQAVLTNICEVKASNAKLTQKV